jgi:hypothetical protein
MGYNKQLTTFFFITKHMFAAFYFSRSRVDKRSLRQWPTFSFFCLVSGDENWFSSLSSCFSVTSLLSLSLFVFAFFFVCVFFFSPGSFFRPPGVSFVFFFFFTVLCSAFYRARELAKTSPYYSPAFTGLLINPRAGSWAKDVVHDRIELLQFSLLNRLSPREMKGIMNSSSKRRRLCPWE